MSILWWEASGDVL